jgi:hypothetical protein
VVRIVSSTNGASRISDRVREGKVLTSPVKVLEVAGSFGTSGGVDIARVSHKKAYSVI